jgi:hypothetical protein
LRGQAVDEAMAWAADDQEAVILYSVPGMSGPPAAPTLAGLAIGPSLPHSRLCGRRQCAGSLQRVAGPAR